jgi:hypothetical protein
MSINTYTFQSNNYSIITSLNERTIYLKITDTVSFYQYEGNIDIKELRLNIELKDAFTIICNCFKEDLNEDYDVTITVNSNMLKLQFNALVGGFLKMNFEILLREKVMSNDGQLTINFNRLEQQQAQSIKSLTEKCAKLENTINNLQQIIDSCQIFMSNIYTPQGHWCDIQTNGQTQVNNISAKEITMNDHSGNIIWKTINVFYQLEKLTINNFTSKNNLKDIKNINLKELILSCGNTGAFNSLVGIENFPNLNKLTITSSPSLNSIPAILKSYKHKINYIKIQYCSQVNVVELQTYCQTNNIKLEIS